MREDMNTQQLSGWTTYEKNSWPYNNNFVKMDIRI